MPTGWEIDWAEVWKSGWVPAIAALVWQWYTWRKRLPDAQWLEILKGEVRRDVEEKLAAQETRLRVGADLQLRLHEKSWDLMREILTAATAAYWATLDFAMFVTNNPGQRTDQSKRREELYEKALQATGKVDVLAATAPTNYDIAPIPRAFKRAFSATLELMNSPTEGKARGDKLAEIREMLAKGVARAGSVCKKWNEDLWSAAEQLPQGVVAPPIPVTSKVRLAASDTNSEADKDDPDGAEREDGTGEVMSTRART